MKRSDAQWQKLYSNYKKSYMKYDEKLPNGMAKKMYSYLQYRNAYTFVESSREAEVAAGKRKVLNTQRDLIVMQKYKYTKDQTAAIVKALKFENEKRLLKQDLTNKEFKKQLRELNKGVKFTEIRQSPEAADKLYQLASDLNKELKMRTIEKDGIEVPEFSGEARQKIISSLIFGSV